MNAIHKRAMKRAIAVFVISMMMGRVAAPLVLSAVLRPVNDWSYYRGTIWVCLLAGTVACGLLGWLEYCLVVRADETKQTNQN